MRRTRAWALIATLVILSLAIAVGACGSDDQSDSSSSNLSAALEQHRAITATAPGQPADPSASTKPTVSNISHIPRLARAQVPPAQSTIRGSGQLTVAQWMDWVVNDVALFWQRSFNAADLPFRPFHYAIFTSPAKTGCKDIPEAKLTDGPFYCPEDETVYMSVPYFQAFYGKIGDASLAVPIAHEVGHHVEKIVGLLSLASIDKELDADCLAGVWAQSLYRRDLLERGDLAEALASRIKVGDPAGTSRTDPHAHGTSRQRVDAFLSGFTAGAPGPCSGTRLSA
jgi:predicted metalloprotease